MPLPTPSPSPSPDPGRPEPAAWARLELDVVTATGSDAVRFIDNFTTAAVSQFAEGTGGESFFTDARGWVIALATLLRTDRGLIMVTAAGLGDRLRDHLEHYHIREAVEIEHAPGGTATILVTGSGAGEAVAAVAGEPPPAKPFDHRPARIGGAEVRLVRVAGQGPDGFWIEVPAVRAGDLEQRLEAAGLPRADAAAIEAARIAARYPAPADIPPKTLPQELGRDARAISFTKGCYLGQETVARIDALGHVNRQLVLLAIDAAPPPLPATVRSGDRDAGVLTSAARCPQRGGTIGLALLQAKLLQAEPLDVAGRAARVLGPAAATPEKHA